MTVIFLCTYTSTIQTELLILLIRLRELLILSTTNNEENEVPPPKSSTLIPLSEDCGNDSKTLTLTTIETTPP